MRILLHRCMAGSQDADYQLDALLSALFLPQHHLLAQLNGRHSSPTTCIMYRYIGVTRDSLDYVVAEMR